VLELKKVVDNINLRPFKHQSAHFGPSSRMISWSSWYIQVGRK